MSTMKWEHQLEYLRAWALDAKSSARLPLLGEAIDTALGKLQDAEAELALIKSNGDIAERTWLVWKNHSDAPMGALVDHNGIKRKWNCGACLACERIGYHLDEPGE